MAEFLGPCGLGEDLEGSDLVTADGVDVIGDAVDDREAGVDGKAADEDPSWLGGDLGERPQVLLDAPVGSPFDEDEVTRHGRCPRGAASSR